MEELHDEEHQTDSARASHGSALVQEDCESQVNEKPFSCIFHPLDWGKDVFKGKFKGKYVALKKVSFVTEDFKILIELKCQHVITYHTCVIGSDRYLVMDLCSGSLFDFVQERLPNELQSALDLTNTMWETTLGLEYLHAKNIVHGCLVTDKILLWQENPDSKPSVKIALGYNSHNESDRKPEIHDDLEALGFVFYSIAAKKLEKPKVQIDEDHLTQLDTNLRCSALMLIKLLLKQNTTGFHLTSAKTLLRHPFYTVNVENARCLLNDESQIKNLEEFKVWYDLKGKMTVIKKDKFDALQVIIPLTFLKEKMIRSGSYGVVYGGKWFDKMGNEIPAACKKLKGINAEKEKDFEKELETLKQLDHLFIIKFLDICKIDNQKCIVMELCEGTLDDYVHGKLLAIKISTLDDRIILGQVSVGLAYIHSKNIIHKDLKPANILLWRKSSKSTLVLAKIADFGFAQQLKFGTYHFSETSKLGTEYFMAPELLEALKSDRKIEATFQSDAYSLGVTIAYTILKGAKDWPIFGGRIIKPLMLKFGSDPLLPEELEWDVTDLIHRLTKKEPSERPRVAIVIYHPYFALTNNNTTAHFHEKASEYFDAIRFWNVYVKFDRKEIQIWMDYVKQNSNPNNVTVQTILKEYDHPLVRKVLNKLINSKIYSKIKEAIASGNDEELEAYLSYKKFNLTDFFRNLIERAPNFSVSYIWYLLNEEIGITPSIPVLGILEGTFIAVDSFIEKDIPKTLHSAELDKIIRMTECTFGFLYLKKEKEKEEIWNEKQASLPNPNENLVDKIIRELPPYATPKDILGKICDNLNDIDDVGHNNRTVLSWAVGHRWCGDVSLIKIILERGANPNATGSTQQIKIGNSFNVDSQLFNIVVSNGGNPNAVNKWNNQTSVHYAAKNVSSSGPEIMQLLLQSGGDSNSKDEWNQTPVHYAAINNSDYGPAVLATLLAKGGNPNSANKQSRTPVHFAAINKSSKAPEIMELLLKAGGNLDASDILSETPIHLVASNKSRFAPKILELLFTANGNPNAVGSFRKTPLHCAAENTSSSAKELFRLLLEYGGNLKVADASFKTPIYYAAENRSPSGLEIMELILERNEDKLIPFILHFAAINDTSSGIEILKLLLKRGENPNEKNSEHHTPLHRAAIINVSTAASDIIKCLLDGGGDPNAVEDKENRTPMHYAAENESSEAPKIMKTLLKGGGNPNSGDKWDFTPLHYAAEKNKSSSVHLIVQTLLEHGANSNAITHNTLSPLHCAMRSKSSSAAKVIELLITNGANPNAAAGYDERTPLHSAVCIKSNELRLEIVKILLENGANPNGVDNNGESKTPVHVVAQNDLEPEILNLLLDKGGDPNAVYQSEMTPALYAAKKNPNISPEVLEILKGAGKDPVAKRESKYTPVHFAAENKSEFGPKIMKILLERKGDPNAVSELKNTPVHFASRNKSKFGYKLLKLLLEFGGNPNTLNIFNQTPFHLAAKK